jgi:hypothetical protein
MCRCIAFIVFMLRLLPVPVFAWYPEDAKSIDQLQLMDDSELNSEASEVCMRAVVARKHEMKRKADAATDYLDTIVRAARDKNHGQVPWWLAEYQHTARTTDAGPCDAIFMKRLDEEIAKEAESQKKSAGRPNKPEVGITKDKGEGAGGGHKQ